jgi:signal recognition particle receptor subunit alpha
LEKVLLGPASADSEVRPAPIAHIYIQLNHTRAGIKTETRTALSAAITRILTPKTSTDLLLSIRARTPSTTSSASSPTPSPYVITFVGVNGVGKSTSLGKVAFWLLQNNLRVLVAACDTFRSGAVEQLRVHVRNLGMLQQGGGADRIELYEKGYGKDAAGIAREAIAYAGTKGFDVVLVDTAGRMQDNEPLMRALAKVSIHRPPLYFTNFA